MINLTTLAIAAVLGLGTMLGLAWWSGRRQSDATQLAILEEIAADAGAHAPAAHGNGPLG